MSESEIKSYENTTVSETSRELKGEEKKWLNCRMADVFELCTLRQPRPDLH